MVGDAGVLQIVLLGHVGQLVPVLEGLQGLVGLGLGVGQGLLLQGLDLLLVDVVAVLVLGLHRLGGEVEIGVFKGVVGVGVVVLFVVGLQVVGGVAAGQLLALFVLGDLGQQVAGEDLLKQPAVHIGAVVGPEESGVAVAVGCGLVLEGLDLGVHVLLDLGLGVAVLLGLGGQGQLLLDGGQGGLQEVVPVGLVLLLVIHLLRVGLAVIQAAAAEHGHRAVKPVAGDMVVITQLCGGQAGIAHGGGGGPGLEEAGVPDQQGGHQPGDHHANGGIGDGLALAGGLLLLGQEGLFGRARALTLFFLSRCAHGMINPLSKSCDRVRNGAKAHR